MTTTDMIEVIPGPEILQAPISPCGNDDIDNYVAMLESGSIDVLVQGTDPEGGVGSINGTSMMRVSFFAIQRGIPVFFFPFRDRPDWIDGSLEPRPLKKTRLYALADTFRAYVLDRAYTDILDNVLSDIADQYLQNPASMGPRILMKYAIGRNI